MIYLKSIQKKSFLTFEKLQNVYDLKELLFKKFLKSFLY